MPHYVKVPIWFEGIKRFKGFPPFDEKIPGLPLLSYHHIIYFMYDCIGIKKNKSVASSKIWMNVCLQWWWAEHGGIKLVPFVIHNLWVDQRYTYRVLQTIWMKLIISCVWAEPAVSGSTKTALKFKYEI